MNILGLIFSILVALTIAFSALFEKQIAAARIRSTHVGHAKANRKILNSYEHEIYTSFKHIPRPRETNENTSSPSTPKETSLPETNPPCARLNLWPLVNEGKEDHPLLYEMTAKLLKNFYGKTLLSDKPKAEYTFLNSLLKSLRAQQDPTFPLEKLSFPDPHHRRLYYLMLKGTKTCNLFQENGYPPLLDYLCLQPDPIKPCLFHAHPHLTSVFFGPKVALKLHHSIHKEDGPKLSQHLIEQYCSEAHTPILQPEIFDLVQTKSCNDKPLLTTFTGTDSETHVSLRKEIPLTKKT